jgi:uncharacterized lipoprotein YddW (UPF0748 family)
MDLSLFFRLTIKKCQQRLKRLLPLLFVFSLVTVLWLDSFTPIVAQDSTTPQIRGVWVTANDKDMLKSRSHLKEAVSQLRRLHFNTIYPVVWNSGYVMYPSEIGQRMGIQHSFYKGSDSRDLLADLIKEAHREGLLVLPWFEFGFMTNETSELALNHPQWLTQTRDGTKTWHGAAGEVVWLNPFHPQVQQFIMNLVVEAVSKYDVDGIQFDDHMSLPVTFGYDKYTIALYTQETGNPPPDNPQSQVWMKWRADKITQFIYQLNLAVKARKPNAIFSVSPNYYDLAYKFHLQDWLNWVRLNLVDELVMQVYRQDIDRFVAQIDRPEIQETKQKIPTAIGIMTGLRNRPVPMARIKAQALAAQRRGLGAAFFYYESLWDEAPEPVDRRQSAFLSLFPSQVVRSLAPVRTEERIPDEITDEIPNGTPNAVPNNIPQRLPRRVPETVPQPVPQNPPANVSDEIPSETPNPVPTPVPQAPPQPAAPVGIPDEITTDEIPNDVPNPVPTPVPQIPPQPAQDEIPNEITDDEIK